MRGSPLMTGVFGVQSQTGVARDPLPTSGIARGAKGIHRLDQRRLLRERRGSHRYDQVDRDHGDWAMQPSVPPMRVIPRAGLR